MKYKNIVFDFGNVIGRFDGKYILRQFCTNDEDYEILSSVVFANWPELDKGTIDYDENAEHALSLVPGHLRDATRKFFREWPKYVEPLESTLTFIDELYDNDVPMYLLSNAPTYFADQATHYDMLKKFRGIVFSAPIRMAKPDPAIYEYLFETFSLDPRECFFIDDLEQNIAAGETFGMDGLVFTGDIDKVKAAVGML